MDVRRSKISSAERSDYCANCNTILLGPFCHGCGQPVKGIVRNFYSVVYDFLNTLVAFDARIWRTLPALLLSPGFLTKEYLSGKRAQYVSPAKLFIFLCLSAFFLIRISSDWSISSEYTSSPNGDNTFVKSGININDSNRESVSNDKQFDWHLPGGRTLTVLGADNKQEVWSITFNSILSAFEARITGVRFLPNSWYLWLDLEFDKARKNIDRVSENPTIFAKAFFGSLPTMLLLMLPIYSAILSLLYFNRKHLYMEHVIVALHGHAYVCLTLLLETIIFLVQESIEPLFWAEIICYGIMLLLFLWVPINLFMMQRRMYSESWLLACIKYIVLTLVYLPLIMLGTMLAAFFSLAEL
ncbi:DUF3667 domain-containing protein [Microbulbifer sp. THAF38]|uniref:DUF3667 domain-containing protein n=1 Tax=Microbulbifer sp. THAF38 TaxID=2587856 RepID=UPI001269739B|nr:DUF3667 domain-containing protein [Microbulbifer sp. THAF38]QFT53321.1 hypothetical protein FIU95_01830 [Microbulbifer sp. THAF38]